MNLKPSIAPARDNTAPVGPARSGQGRLKLVGLLGKVLIDLIGRSVRVESHGPAAVSPLLASRKFIFAFWHSRILLISYIFKGWDGAILVSRSNDGEIIARILQQQGHETIRGSTAKGGLRALAALIKRLKARPRPGAVIPDGPQGPRFRVHPGVIVLAKKTGYPIIPVTYSARRMKVFKSWDRFILPCPFTHCRLSYGEPLWVSAALDKNGDERCRQKLETEMVRITQECDRYYHHAIA